MKITDFADVAFNLTNELGKFSNSRSSNFSFNYTAPALSQQLISGNLAMNTAQSGSTRPSVLAPIMQREGIYSAKSAARIYANRNLGIPDNRILSIEPAEPGRTTASGPSWVPQIITYTTGKQPSKQEQARLSQLEDRIGRLTIALGMEGAVTGVGLFSLGLSIKGAQLARYRATLDSGFKRYGSDMAADLAAKGPWVVGTALSANTTRIVADGKLGKLNALHDEYNEVFIRAYGIKQIMVR